MSKNDSKNKKRDKPDEKEWSWSDTELADEKETTILAQDVKQLLITRGEDKKNLKGKKVELIRFLKERYDVGLKEPVEDLTVRELLVELRLRGINDSPAKKDVLIGRLKGDIVDEEPARKKPRGRGKKKKGSEVYVLLYTPAEDEDNTEVQVLGLFKSEKRAYTKGKDKLIDDLKTYDDDKKKKKSDAAIKKINEEKDWEKALEMAGEQLNKICGGEDKAPYVTVKVSKITHN